MKAEGFPAYRYHVREVIDTHDADTLRVVLDLGCEVYHRRYLRLIGVYGVELSETGGQAARGLLVETLAGNQGLYVRTQWDEYSWNRLLAWLYADMGGDELVDVNAVVAKKLADAGLTGGRGAEKRLVKI